MFTEEDLLPISALQHYVFCPRQCGLIHVAGVWAENRLTAEGRVRHERVHGRGEERRGDVRREFGLRLQSLRLGLSGQADVVEFHRSGPQWIPFPVEHKRGKPKSDRCDAVQLCAQAMCLEEMTGQDVPQGALFYGTTRRRQDVCFEKELREKTEQAAEAVRNMIQGKSIPSVERGKRCRACSLAEICGPDLVTGERVVEDYLMSQIRSCTEE